MGLGLTALERLARARVRPAHGRWRWCCAARTARRWCCAAETATAGRLAELRALGPVDLALTGWRAETLKARAYDGDLARVALPADADLAWVRATADPSADLAWPMKGPYRDPARRRGGAAPGGDRALQAGASAAGGAGGAARRGRRRRWPPRPG